MSSRKYRTRTRGNAFAHVFAMFCNATIKTMHLQDKHFCHQRLLLHDLDPGRVRPLHLLQCGCRDDCPRADEAFPISHCIQAVCHIARGGRGMRHLFRSRPPSWRRGCHQGWWHGLCGSFRFLARGQSLARDLGWLSWEGARAPAWLSCGAGPERPPSSVLLVAEVVDCRFLRRTMKAKVVAGGVWPC